MELPFVCVKMRKRKRNFSRPRVSGGELQTRGHIPWPPSLPALPTVVGCPCYHNNPNVMVLQSEGRAGVKSHTRSCDIHLCFVVVKILAQSDQLNTKLLGLHTHTKKYWWSCSPMIPWHNCFSLILSDCVDFGTLWVCCGLTFIYIYI